MMESQAAQAVTMVVQLQSHIGCALMWLRPDGGQARARRNAWAAMVADSQRRHERAAERDPLRAAVLAPSALSVQAR